MGGAIQALWCLSKNSPAESGGKKITIEALADEHVSLEGGATVKPDMKEEAAYDKAYEIYSGYLRALSPLFK
jgi:sugar (pentulose or hexulose) kinase